MAWRTSYDNAPGAVPDRVKLTNCLFVGGLLFFFTMTVPESGCVRAGGRDCDSFRQFLQLPAKCLEPGGSAGEEMASLRTAFPGSLCSPYTGPSPFPLLLSSPFLGHFISALFFARMLGPQLFIWWPPSCDLGTSLMVYLFDEAFWVIFTYK